MEKEEEILEGYIKGTKHGEDNKLRATVGSLGSKRSKELSDSINTLKNTISHSVSNLIINNTHNAGELKRGIDEQVQNLNQGIARQAENIISSNERLSESNESNAQKTHKFTIVNIFLTVIIAATGVIGLWNIYLTNEIKDESIKANQISEQPFLNFVDEGQPFKFINSGKGVALNIILLVWDKPQKQLYITPESSVGEALGVDKNGVIENTQLDKANINQIKKQIPRIAKAIDIAQSKDTAWFALVYDDIYGKTFVTLVRGTGGDYREAVQFIRLSEN